MTMDPQNPAPGADGQGGGTSPHWLETIPEDLKYEAKGDDGKTVEMALRDHPKLKEFAGKDIGEFAKSYAELNKLVGKKAGLQPLSEDASDEDKATFDQGLRQLLGVPETPEGYEIKMPEGAVKDEAMSGWFSKTAHELGFSPAQAQALSDAFGVFGQEYWDAKLDADNKAATETLTKEFGDKAAEVAETAKRGFQAAAKRAGIESGEAELFLAAHGNDPTVLKVFKVFGEVFKEDGIPDGGGGTPGAVQGAKDTADFYKEDVFGGK